MKRRLPIIGALLSLLVAVGGCTVYYETADVRRAMADPARQATQAVDKAAADVRQKQAMVSALTERADPHEPPYPSLRAQLAEVEQALQALRVRQQAIDQQRQRFEQLARGRSRIQSNQPQWKALKQVRADYEAALTAFETAAGDYARHANQFTALANRHHIARITVAEIRAKVERYVADIDQQLPQVKQRLTRAQAMAAAQRRLGGDPGKLEKREAALAELADLADQIGQLREALGEVMDGFRAETHEHTALWVGPGMRTHTVMEELRGIGEEITELARRFDAVAARLSEG